MTFGALTIQIVEPGTVITDSETGVEITVDDGCAVIDQRHGIARVTQRVFDALKDQVPAK